MTSACRWCGRSIAGTSKDPIVSLRGGTFHFACMSEAARERDADLARRREETRAKRSEAMRARMARERDGSCPT